MVHIRALLCVCVCYSEVVYNMTEYLHTQLCSPNDLSPHKSDDDSVCTVVENCFKALPHVTTSTRNSLNNYFMTMFD